MTDHQKMDEEEMRSILEDLARTGPPSARVAAIRVLHKLTREETEKHGTQTEKRHRDRHRPGHV